MRKFIQITFLGLFILMSGNLLAQSQKIAYVDSDAILSELPAKKQMDSELESYKTQLSKALETEQQQFNAWAQEIIAKAQQGEMSPKEQKEKEAEIQAKQQDLQKKAFEADQKLAKKEQDLSKPIIDKFNAALKKVAEAKGYTYILDIKLFLYMEGGIDATADVKAAM